MTKTEKILFTKGIRPTEMRLKIYKYLKRKTYADSLNEMQKVFLKKKVKVTKQQIKPRFIER
jgi:Fur family ferric uptake transcriptional regulator